jgi:hypothetical protein
LKNTGTEPEERLPPNRENTGTAHLENIGTKKEKIKNKPVFRTPIPIRGDPYVFGPRAKMSRIRNTGIDTGKEKSSAQRQKQPQN